MDMEDAAAERPPAVEFQHVGKTYPGRGIGARKLTALHDVSFRLEAGAALGLLGPNRAGKTTLLKILLGVTRPTTGRALRFGFDGGDRSTMARVGYVHEKHAFPPYLTALDLLRYYGTLAGAAELPERVPALLERMGLGDRAKEPIGRFSKGMMQRLGLAQALLDKPDLLVLDEPTEGLDFEGRRLTRQVIEEVRSAGRTVILVSHALAEVELVCDRLAVLDAGRLAFFGLKRDFAPEAGGLEAALERLALQRGAA
jgi:ABC-2 type transport system ATP-binding protein